MILLGAIAGAAEAQVPVTPPAASKAPATPPAPSPAPPAGSAPPSSAPPAAKPPAIVPTYWVLMVTGEKDGVPWIKTATPETLGGSIKNTGPWTCSYPPTERGAEDGTGYEQMEVGCGIGDAEVFMNLRCNFRTKAKPGKLAGKVWKRSDLQTLNLRRKGDAKSTITVSLRCDVDAAFSVD